MGRRNSKWLALKAWQALCGTRGLNGQKPKVCRVPVELQDAYWLSAARVTGQAAHPEATPRPPGSVDPLCVTTTFPKNSKSVRPALGFSCHDKLWLTSPELGNDVHFFLLSAFMLFLFCPNKVIKLFHKFNSIFVKGLNHHSEYSIKNICFDPQAWKTYIKDLYLKAQ
jgi:hypothetical protein